MSRKLVLTQRALADIESAARWWSKNRSTEEAHRTESFGAKKTTPPTR